MYAHELTYPEFLKAREGVMTVQGKMIGGPDRKHDNPKTKWLSWQRDVQAACRSNGEISVPQRVVDYYQETKHLVKPPAVGDLNVNQTGKIDKKLICLDECAAISEEAYKSIKTLRTLMAFKPPRFTWSYTSLQEFLTCPAQWAAKRFYKTIKDVESEAMLVGNLIHETAEHYLKSKTGQTFQQSKIHSQYLPVVQKYCDAMAASGGQIHVEKEMCFDNQMRVSSWRAWDTVWVRSKADVLVKTTKVVEDTNGDIVKQVKLSVVDYKTGKYKEDFLQLKMFAVFAALTPGFEDVQEFDPKFIFTKEPAPRNILRLEKPIQRSELKGVLAEILAVVRRMEAAWESENFPAKKNGLCRNYCSNTDCTHCGG